jgi:hypothetical protein
MYYDLQRPMNDKVKYSLKDVISLTESKLQCFSSSFAILSLRSRSLLIRSLADLAMSSVVWFQAGGAWGGFKDGIGVFDTAENIVDCGKEENARQFRRKGGVTVLMQPFVESKVMYRKPTAARPAVNAVPHPRALCRWSIDDRRSEPARMAVISVFFLFLSKKKSF